MRGRKRCSAPTYLQAIFLVDGHLLVASPDLYVLSGGASDSGHLLLANVTEFLL